MYIGIQTFVKIRSKTGITSPVKPLGKHQTIKVYWQNIIISTILAAFHVHNTDDGLSGAGRRRGAGRRGPSPVITVLLHWNTTTTKEKFRNNHSRRGYYFTRPIRVIRILECCEYNITHLIYFIIALFRDSRYKREPVFFYRPPIISNLSSRHCYVGIETVGIGITYSEHRGTGRYVNSTGTMGV